MAQRLGACYERIAKWMIFTDPPAHRRLRSVIAKAFGPGATRALEPFVDELANDLVVADQRGEIELVGDLACPLTTATTARVIGLPPEAASDMTRWSTNVFRLLGAGVYSKDAAETADVVETAYESLIECETCVRDAIGSRAADQADDLLGQLMRAHTDGSVSEDEVIGSCIMFMIGGHESPRNLIANGLLALLRNPRELAKLRDHPGLADSAAEELLRYEGPSLCLVRRAVEDVEVGGRQIRAGDLVFAAIRAGNRDPDEFSDPHRLDIERAPNHHLGFGRATHFCVAAPLGRLLVSTAVRAVINREPELALDDRSLRWFPSLARRGLEALPVKLHRQRPPHPQPTASPAA